MLKATAGLRLLPPVKAHALLQQVKKNLSLCFTVVPFAIYSLWCLNLFQVRDVFYESPFTVPANSVSIMDGTSEGLSTSWPIQSLWIDQSSQVIFSWWCLMRETRTLKHLSTWLGFVRLENRNWKLKPFTMMCNWIQCKYQMWCSLQKKNDIQELIINMECFLLRM